MTNRLVFGTAAAAWCGALVPVDVPLVALGLALVALTCTRRAIVVPLAVLLVCSTFSARSWAGLEPASPGPVSGTATVVIDPERNGPATTAVIRLDGRRYLATGYAGGGARLAQATAGDQVEVTGNRRPYAGSAERRAALHAADRLVIETADVTPTRHPLWRVANQVRSWIGGGAASLPEDRRALFTGIVYGDDRQQSAEHDVDFRLVGLTHLLAVSGQNVAYALTVMGPLIRRGGRSSRWISTLAILLVFATVTRFEPSVLRATVMAAIAVTGRTLGRETESGRALALAVVVLLIIDPLLAETVAFRLSVAASAGIIWFGPAIRSRMGGPTWLREGVAVTTAAQLAVAPVIVSTFGPISPLSIPANVIAGPLAGGVMAWGMSAGVVAGVLGGPWAATIHVVTDAGLLALERVASTAAAAPVGRVGLPWIAAVLAVVLLRPWWQLSRTAFVGAASLTVALAWALVPSPQQGVHEVGWDSRIHVVRGAVTLDLGDERSPARLLEDLAVLGVRRVDVVMTDDQSEALDLVSKRLHVAEVRLAEPDPS